MIRRVGSIFILLFVFLASCQKEPAVSTQMEESFYVRSGDADIPAFVYGNGASNVFILVVHGGPGGNGLEYRLGTYAEQLEENYAMVYTDQRHQGNSHGHLVDEDITVDNMVEDLYATVRAIKARYGQDISLFMMGHSWGGTLGTAYMVKEDYEEELNGWIEVDGAHDIPLLNIELVKMIREIGSNEVALGKNVDKWNPILEFVNNIDTNNIAYDDTGILNGYGYDAQNLIEEINRSNNNHINIFNYSFLTPNNPGMAEINGQQLPESFIREVEATALTDQLENITIPTLFQWGKYDFVVPPALAYSAFNKISSTEKHLKIYEHSGHSPMNNETELFVNDMITFIETYK